MCHTQSRRLSVQPATQPNITKTIFNRKFYTIARPLRYKYKLRDEKINSENIESKEMKRMSEKTKNEVKDGNSDDKNDEKPYKIKEKWLHYLSFKWFLVNGHITNGDDTSFITNSQETISQRSVSWNGRKKNPKEKRNEIKIRICSYS